uniref:P-type ATPase N-terminal domain-containing protein n=2 Tax=Phlebotomus papatasi TaxID=29031 RepID=A0A1B0D0T9_PHLPP
MGDLEDLRKKPSTLPINIKPTGGIPSASSSDSGSSSSDESQVPVGQLPIVGRKEPERTYIFPGVTGSSGGVGGGGSSLDSGLVSGSRGHARSVSHGGGAIASSYGSVSRPSALKSAMRGHQRALSQGQITDSTGSGQGTRSGHNRVGSKTDFILPPGHKDSPEAREPTQSATSGGRGHSRQASRSESIYTLRRTELPPWWKRFLFCRGDKGDDCAFRTVVPNHTVPPKTPKREHPNGRRVGNKIRTTKYTLLSFLPKNLLEQFHRVANLYFIFIVLLNWFPAINAFGKEIAMIPVLFVLGVTAIKDLFEDRRRRSSDKRINNTTCRVYNG